MKAAQGNAPTNHVFGKLVETMIAQSQRRSPTRAKTLRASTLLSRGAASRPRELAAQRVHGAQNASAIQIGEGAGTEPPRVNRKNSIKRYVRNYVHR